MSDLILFWHRRDLRLCDHLGLNAATQQSPKVIGVFCLDPNILQRDDIAPVRVAYMLGCLQSLQEEYSKINGELLIFQETPQNILPKLAKTLQAKAVYWTLDVEPFARQRDQEVQNCLESEGILVQTCWDQLLHSPGEVLTQNDSPYTVYTPFWRNWSQQTKLQPIDPPKRLEGLNSEEREWVESLGAVALPTAAELGYGWENGFILDPGTTAARDQLEAFCDRTLYNYQEDRNFPALDGTSRLSPALKFGAIGIREIWQASQFAYDNCRSDEARKNVETWQKELAWREFNQHALYFFPELEKQSFREIFHNFPWENNEDYFTAWCEGKTGYPIADAAMRQLNETGWMHNRCRMIVASFLTKDLIIDWRWGEKYFMQHLIDGDLASNNGGWQWSASCGLDTRPLRIFNPSSQTQKYDPEGEYIRQWLPELSSMDAEYLVTGKISPLDRESCGYVQPIVDHRQRQQQFKQLYKQEKEMRG